MEIVCFRFLDLLFTKRSVCVRNCHWLSCVSVCMCKKSSQPTNQTTTTLTTTTTIMQQPIASKPAKPHRLNILHPLSITHEILTSRTIKSDDSIMIIYQCNEKIKRIFCEIYCCVLVWLDCENQNYIIFLRVVNLIWKVWRYIVYRLCWRKISTTALH